VLNYYDFETEEKMVMCAQSGCLHNAYSCVAYLGGADSFAEYRGKWYIIDTIEEQSIQLTEIDPASGTRTVLCTIPRGEADIISQGGCTFAYGNGYLYAGSHTFLSDGSSAYKELLYRVDLETGEYEQIVYATENETVYVLGASEDSALLQRLSLSEDMLSEAAYKAQFGQEADYMEYSGTFFEEHQTFELGLYDLESKRYSVIADEKNDGFRHSSNYKFCYENLVIYQLGDDLMLYDLTENVSRKLLTRENIVNYWLIDNRAFYITNTNEYYQLYYADLETGESTLHKNNDRTDRTHFALSAETENYFFGICGELEGNYWIKKTDFYNDDYSNVKQLN
jgi:hypothetical protein